MVPELPVPTPQPTPLLSQRKGLRPREGKGLPWVTQHKGQMQEEEGTAGLSLAGQSWQRGATGMGTQGLAPREAGAWAGPGFWCHWPPSGRCGEQSLDSPSEGPLPFGNSPGEEPCLAERGREPQSPHKQNLCVVFMSSHPSISRGPGKKGLPRSLRDTSRCDPASSHPPGTSWATDPRAGCAFIAESQRAPRGRAGPAQGRGLPGTRGPPRWLPTGGLSCPGRDLPARGGRGVGPGACTRVVGGS